jgi:hypothetical protein
VEEYGNIGNECKRGSYTYNTFYTSQIINIRAGGLFSDKQGLIFNYALFGTLTGRLINSFSL